MIGIPRMRRSRVLLALLVLAAPLAAVGLRHVFWHQHLKRFQEVRPGVLYRSGLESQFGLDYVVSAYGVRTILTALADDPILRQGLIDPGRPSGQRETQCAAAHGVEIVRLPMGDEACWPFPTPWQFEEFFALCDDRRRWPILLHCVGGRHRTGVLSALFRLEYDRWAPQRALEEMYSFDFGPPQTISEHNLRTYVPRPRPDAAEWSALRQAFAAPLGAAPDRYEDLIESLRQRLHEPPIVEAVGNYVSSERAFGLPLAQRLFPSLETDASGSADGLPPALALAVARADRLVSAPEAGHAPDADELVAAAALIADFGSSEQQDRLAAALRQGIETAEPDERHHALASGVLNRYTRNRLPFWRIVLDDRRPRFDSTAPGRRYCDTVAARLSIVIDQALIDGHDEAAWDRGVDAARAWFESRAAELRFTRLIPPEGRKGSRQGDGIVVEDLSRVRR